MDNRASQQDVLSGLGRVGVVCVVTVYEVDGARELVGALLGGGLPYVEITLRTPAGLAALSAAADLGACLGAGTVTTAADAELAIAAGARFVVSPGLDAGVVGVCRDAEIPMIPGVATPTEVMAARALGLRTVKIFPAAQLGGADVVRAFASVWPDMRFVPTGGISRATAADYLAIPAVLAVGGSWMTPAALVRDKAWTAVEDLARDTATLRGGG